MAPDLPLADLVWDQLDQSPTITNSFRYTEEELEALDDAQHEVNKQSGAKLSKQEIARLGLLVVLEDFRVRGAQSLLAALARRRKRRGRGGG